MYGVDVALVLVGSRWASWNNCVTVVTSSSENINTHSDIVDILLDALPPWLMKVSAQLQFSADLFFLGVHNDPGLGQRLRIPVLQVFKKLQPDSVMGKEKEGKFGASFCL